MNQQPPELPILGEGLVEEPAEAPPAPQGLTIKKSKYPGSADEYYKLLNTSGFYPDIDDPNFVARLLSKYEFADTVSSADESANTCDAKYGFEISPVQRFVANFLHPGTPYMGALLYHGVGVGKTCAAIQSAEAYLDTFPNRKVIIICPSAIRQGFRRTIFDFTERGLSIGKGATPNAGRGCTGNTYLNLSETLFERNPEIIRTRISKVIDRRYAFFGYIEFRNYIRNSIALKRTPEERAYALRKEFNYRMIIIDEAHNLPDYKEDQYDADEELDETIDTNDEAGPEPEPEAKGGPLTEKASGASLTPFLQRVLENTEGIKLLLMTATPMYNNVFEIYTLLNLLLLNDKKPLLEMKTILNADGSLAEGAERFLKPIANAYVSFMRGENPYSFPLRLYPEGMDPNGTPVNRLTKETYPTYELGPADTVQISQEDKENISKLPIVVSIAKTDSTFKKILSQTTQIKSRKELGGLSGNNVNYLLQVGNVVFPPEDEDEYDVSHPQSYVSSNGFLNVFEKQKASLRCKIDPSWLLNEEDKLELYSPKLATVLRYVKHAEGVEFVFSQFVSSGALLTAVALEANGYEPYGRGPILLNRPPSPLGGQCALCPNRKKEHKGQDHDFKQARYGLLTGDKQFSPKLEDVIAAAVSPENMDGSVVKVIVGSKVASEGIDLKYIREVHILDSWWHMNRIEQIIGRGIRFCSHAALDETKRNTTVFLHAIQMEQTNTMESADLYCYRIGINKEIKKGQVSRLLKVFAVDCNLRKDVTILKGKGRRKQIDSQRQSRNGPNGEVQEEGEGVLLDDMPFSAVCDWMECKPIRCEPDVPVQVTASDDSTYTTFSAKFRETAILKLVSLIFAEQPWHRSADLIQTLVQRGIPRTAIDIVLQQIVNNRLYRFKSGGQEGYLVYKNNYFLFQPEAYRSLQIPMALRIAAFPVKRDEYTPVEMKTQQVEQPLIKEATGEVVEKGLLEAREFWTAVQDWMMKLVSGTQTQISLDIERKIELFTTSLPALKAIFVEKLKAILYLKTKIPAERAELFKQICLDFIWDEFLHPTIQAKLVLEEPYLAGREQLVQGETMRAVRYIDAQTGEMRFMCQGGIDCDPDLAQALVEFANEKDDSLSKRKADSKHAGDLYGFIVPKKGDKLVFKTQDVKAPGVKLDKGKECAIVSKGHSIEKLVQLGVILQKAGEPTLDLDAGHLAAVGHIIDNSVKGCTLLDLVLRYMDALRIKQKRWFFRPIAAYVAGLHGVVAPKAVVAKKPTAAVKPAKKKPVLKVAAPIAAVAAVPKENTLDSAPPPLERIPQIAPADDESSNNESLSPQPTGPRRRLVLRQPTPVVEEPPAVPLPQAAEEAPVATEEESNNDSPLPQPTGQRRRLVLRQPSPADVQPLESPSPPRVPTPPPRVPTPPPRVPIPPPRVPTPPPPAAVKKNDKKKKQQNNLTFADLGLENAENFLNF